ncbi:Uu.00g094800.m01.CDS01 [Anthostomella pinea]|uniref:Uu.00g094800.m01.CDS01 n=1 Tax=Anthostomella pinea TaxID=933095 RepID=A0AAI8YIA7_9PEZI|nr:Uu.00g094800.m01.CDS01 [Anthostomella pinea]
MATRFPSALPRRPSAIPTTTTITTSHTPLSHTPSRAATIIRRPRRPYTFTQLVQLSDGSTYTMRTSSPVGYYKSTKDTRNHVLWQPSEKSLRNVEVDEAGKLAAFRGRFGRGWDAEKTGDGGEEGASAAAGEGVGGEAGAEAGRKEEGTGDSLADMIAGYSTPQQNIKEDKPLRKKK